MIHKGHVLEPIEVQDTAVMVQHTSGHFSAAHAMGKRICASCLHLSLENIYFIYPTANPQKFLMNSEQRHCFRYVFTRPSKRLNVILLEMLRKR